MEFPQLFVFLLLFKINLVISTPLPSEYLEIRQNYSKDVASIILNEEGKKFLDVFQYSQPYLLGNSLEPELVKSLILPEYFEHVFELTKDLTKARNVDDILQLDLIKGVGLPCVGSVLELLIRASNWTVGAEIWKEENTWALQMVDSYWKALPEGLLSGHVNYFGDFDECVQAKAENINILNKVIPGVTPKKFEGTYCTVYLADYATAMPGTKFPPADDSKSKRQGQVGNLHARNNGGGNNIMESVSLEEFINLLSSPGIRIVPSVGSCLPNTCSRDEVQQLLVNLLDSVYKNSSDKFPGYPTESLWPFTLACYEEKKPDFDTADISVISLLSVIAGFALLTGAIEYWLNAGNDKPPQRSTAYQYLMSFSLFTNIKEWSSTKRPRGDIGCLHGLRFFSTSWIVLSHTYYAVNFLPVLNMVDVKRVHEDWIVLTVLNSSFSVDTFFVISSMLVTNTIMRTLDRSKGRINIITLYLKRYLRLTPTYAILVGIMATLIPYMGNGPYWAVMNQWGTICEKNWWTNILYVNNLVKTNEMCNGETWYLASDYQFFLLSPFIVFPIWKWQMLGLILLGCYTVLSCVGPALVVHMLDISPTLIPTVDVTIGKAFTHLYIRPYTRISPYLVGIWLGWILYKTKGKQIKMNPIVVTLCWLITTASALALIYGIKPWFDPNEDIPKAGSLAYAALSRFAWGVLISWIIFACIKGYGGVINKFLSWRAFMPLARLCYCVYLVSLHLQMILHVRFKQAIKYDPYNQMIFFLAHMVMSFMVGFVLYQLFESPFMNLQRLIFDGPKKTDRPKDDDRQRPSKRYGIYYNTEQDVMEGKAGESNGIEAIENNKNS